MAPATSPQTTSARPDSGATRQPTRYGRAGKRLVDIVCSAVLLLLGFPIAGWVGVGLLLSVGRPTLERHFRVGRNGRPIEVMRLRTVSRDRLLDLTDDGSPEYFIDEWRTSFSAVVARHGLDRFPQLWHVLRGQMSLVGPRPALWVEVVGAGVLDHPRHAVRPGIIGPGREAATEGRSRLSAGLAADAAYVEHISLRGDVRIVRQAWRSRRGRASAVEAGVTRRSVQGRSVQGRSVQGGSVPGEDSVEASP